MRADTRYSNLLRTIEKLRYTKKTMTSFKLEKAIHTAGGQGRSAIHMLKILPAVLVVVLMDIVSDDLTPQIDMNLNNKHTHFVIFLIDTI